MLKISLFLFFLLIFTEEVFSARLLKGKEEGLEYLLFEEIPLVVTASKKTEAVFEAPAMVYVITKNHIAVRGYVNLEDVLEDLPGMETIPYAQTEFATRVPVRGVQGNNKIVILVNGTRINPPGGEEVVLRSDNSIRMAEQIEIIYGPGSTLYGQDAISAVINILTKKPIDKQDFIEGAVYGGSNDTFGVYTGMSKKMGETGISAYLQFGESDLTNMKEEYSDYYSRKYSSSINDQFKRFEKALNIFVRMENGNNSFQLWYRKSQRSSAEGGFAGILYYVPEAIWDDSSLVMEAKNTFPLNDQMILESVLTYNKYEIDPDSRYIWPLGNSLFYDDWKYGLGKGISFEEKLVYNMSDNISILGGFVYTQYDITGKATIPGKADPEKDVSSQGGSFTYYTRKGDLGSAVNVTRVNNLVYDNYGIYIEPQIRLSSIFKIVLGGRMDKNSRLNDVAYSPRFAAIYSPHENVYLKYIYNQAFVAPKPFDAYFTADNGVSFFTHNPDLEAEEAISNEVNISYNTQDLLLGISFYYNEQDNIVITDESAPSLGTVWMDVAGILSRKLRKATNLGESKAKGMDLYGKFNTDILALWASYSYVDYEIRLGSRTVDSTGISNTNVRLGVTWYLSEALSITPSLVYRSKPLNVLDDHDLDVDDPYKIDLFILYKVTPLFELYGNFINITNNEYGLQGTATLIPQELFSAVVGIKARI